MNFFNTIGLIANIILFISGIERKNTTLIVFPTLIFIIFLYQFYLSITKKK